MRLSCICLQSLAYQGLTGLLAIQNPCKKDSLFLRKSKKYLYILFRRRQNEGQKNSSRCIELLQCEYMRNRYGPLGSRRNARMVDDDSRFSVGRREGGDSASYIALTVGRNLKTTEAGKEKASPQ